MVCATSVADSNATPLMSECVHEAALTRTHILRILGWQWRYRWVRSQNACETAGTGYCRLRMSAVNTTMRRARRQQARKLKGDGSGDWGCKLVPWREGQLLCTDEEATHITGTHMWWSILLRQILRSHLANHIFRTFKIRRPHRRSFRKQPRIHNFNHCRSFDHWSRQILGRTPARLDLLTSASICSPNRCFRHTLIFSPVACKCFRTCHPTVASLYLQCSYATGGTLFQQSRNHFTTSLSGTVTVNQVYVMYVPESVHQYSSITVRYWGSANHCHMLLFTAHPRLLYLHHCC